MKLEKRGITGQMQNNKKSELNYNLGAQTAGWGNITQMGGVAEQPFGASFDQQQTPLQNWQTSSTSQPLAGISANESGSDKQDATLDIAAPQEQKAEAATQNPPKPKHQLPDYAPSVESLKEKMTGPDGEFRQLHSSDIELWIDAVFNSGEIDENKWELIKLLNNMHIFALYDEYEPQRQAEAEAEKNWYKSAKRLKFEQEEKERQEKKDTEPQTMFFGNDTVKVGDAVVNKTVETTNNQEKRSNFDQTQITDNVPGEKVNILTKTTENNQQQGFGDLKMAENHSTEEKDNQEDNQDEKYQELKDAAINLLQGFGKDVTQQSIQDTVEILKKDANKNAIAEAGNFIANSDIVYINAGASSLELGKMLPISDKISEYLSLGVSFVYIKSLDDCYIMGGFGAGKMNGAAISFMHLPKEIKQLQEQMCSEKDEKKKDDLRKEIKDKTEDIINGVSVEATAVAGAGFKNIWLKDGRTISGFSVGLGAGLVGGYSYGKSERDKLEKRIKLIEEGEVVVG